MYVSCIHKIFVRNRLELAFINTTEIVLQLYLFPLLIEAACFVIKSAIIIFLSLLGVSKTPSRGRGRGRGRGSGSGCLLFFPIFFFCDLFANRFLLVEKVSVGLQRKILLKKFRNKWNCACDKLPSVDSLSRENGHVVNHSRVLLS